MNLVVAKAKTHFWHKKYGHLHCSGLKHLSKQNRIIAMLKIESLKVVCEGYLVGGGVIVKSFHMRL